MQPFSFATCAPGTNHRSDFPRPACRGSRLSAGKGISAALKGVGLRIRPGMRACVSIDLAFVQVSVLTIDTNPPPAFTRCATNTLNAERGVRNAE
jgi:hypothetical protein